MGESRVLDCLYCTAILCPNLVRIMTYFLTFYEGSMNKEKQNTEAIILRCFEENILI